MALFKIFKGNETAKLTDTNATGYRVPTDGYAYYDTSTKLFYIDADYNDNGTITRSPINAGTAIKLATARSLKTKLDSTTAVTFDGSADQNAIPVTGTLPIANGGTGATAAAGARTNLEVMRYINTTDNATWTADTLGATTSVAFTRNNITGAHATGHIVWLNANDIGTPFQLVVHDSSELYFWKRWKNSGTWTSWTKMNAGYADSAGSLDNQVRTFGNISPSMMGSGTTTDNETNRKAFIKYICDHYPNAALHIGTYNPNSLGPCIGNIYNVSDISNGSPRYSTFIYHNLEGGLVSFGTSNYNYYERTYVYNSGTWGISITGNAATATKANGLVDGTSTMTSAYNKPGLAYGDYTWLAGWNGYELRAVNKSQFAQASHTHSYLPLSGGTMTGWITFDAEQGIYARIKRKKADGGGWSYSPISMIGNDNAAFAAIGVYGSANTMTYMYIGANAYNGNNLYIYPDGHIWATKVYGAVWNDYAEYRKDNSKENQEPGRCIRELGDGSLALTTQRLERGCEIVSDTFGFAIGQDEKNGYNTPIASNGRVLAYPYESIEEFASHIGWPVCSGPNGTVSIMTEEEEEKYPSRIIGTISEIPTYEEWGTGSVKVNGRVWIRIK